MTIVTESATSLVKKGYNYVTLPPQIIQLLLDPNALAIWCYLQSQSDGWIIRRTHILDHFSFGRTKYDKAMKFLKAHGLVWLEIERDHGGRVASKRIICSNVPNRVEAEKFLKKNPDITVDHSAGFPQDGESTRRSTLPLNKESITNKELSLNNNIITLIDVTWLPDEDTIRDLTFVLSVEESFINNCVPMFAGHFNGQYLTNPTGEFLKWVQREINMMEKSL